MDAEPSLISFAPLDGGPTGVLNSLTIAATGTASAKQQLPGNTTNKASATAGEAVFYKQIQVANQSSVWAYVTFGGAALQVATTSSYPVAPGAVVVVTINGRHTWVSVILDAAGTGNVIFNRGQGI